MSHSRKPMDPNPDSGGLLIPMLLGLAVAGGLVYFFGADDLVASWERTAVDWGQGLVDRLVR